MNVHTFIYTVIHNTHIYVIVSIHFLGLRHISQKTFKLAASLDWKAWQLRKSIENGASVKIILHQGMSDHICIQPTWVFHSN